MRILLSIGCNRYDNTTDLSVAEQDAQRVFDALIRPEIGDYSKEQSRLLLSPSLVEVRKAIQHTLYQCGPLDTFTFFFAGHGGVRSGSFYMWVRDSNYLSQSISALSLADLFRNLNETVPQQSNIIIDACESGGLINDLTTLLKSDVLGNSQTPGITLLATSAQNQYSEEDQSGGIGTNALLDCIEGRELIQDYSPALDLVEIGRHVSTKLRVMGQDPVVWGLNLSGPPNFCRNPWVTSDPTRPLRAILQTWPGAGQSLLQERRDDLWRAYSSTSAEWDPRVFSETISAALELLDGNPAELASFARRFCAAAMERSRDCSDRFRPAQVSASIAVALLPYLQHVVTRQLAAELVTTTCKAILEASEELLDDIRADEFALLRGSGSGLAQLYFLPIRITQMLGWVASAGWLTDVGGESEKRIPALFTDILRTILEQYSGSLVSLNDCQGTYLALILSYAKSLELQDEAELVLGYFFSSLVQCEGKLARADIPPDKVLDYLLHRDTGTLEKCFDLIEKPIETLSVLIRCSTVLGLDDTINEDLWRIDRLDFIAYVTSDYEQYGQETMRGGTNCVWSIGGDVFKCSDLTESWPQHSMPKGREEFALAILASLLFPDRVPWHVVPLPIQTCTE